MFPGKEAQRAGPQVPGLDAGHDWAMATGHTGTRMVGEVKGLGPHLGGG